MFGLEKNAATALGSYAYDVNSEIIYDFRIAKYESSERELARMHIKRLKELGLSGAVILADRGYPSYELMAELVDNGFEFLIRIPKSWTIVVEMLRYNHDENDFYFELNDRRYDFRAYQVTLDNGEHEWLVTSLDEQTLSAAEAKELYAKAVRVCGLLLFWEKVILEELLGMKKQLPDSADSCYNLFFNNGLANTYVDGS